MSATTLRPLALIAATLFAATGACAAEVYTQVGVPGLMLGLAQPVNERVTLRADLGSAGTHDRNSTEEGIAYAGRVKTGRVGLFADWFVAGGSFRLTGGVTSNNYKIDLDAAGAGRTVQVGDGSYTLGPADGLTMLIKFPSTTPYLGIGWGHQQGETGWRFTADIGAMIGRATVTATPRGVLATDAAKADVEKELAQVRDGAGKVRAIPQLSIGVGYAF